MPQIPINILEINAEGMGQYEFVEGRIEGQIKAGIDVSADACHGISLGIEPHLVGNITGQAQALFIGAKATGQASARAGIHVNARVSPNPFDTLGLSIEGGAYAFAAAAGRIGIYLTPQYFAEFIEDALDDDLPLDLFLIFAEEINAEVGVWGKAAVSAAIDGHLNVIFKLDSADAGFEISGGFNAGWGGGTGWDFYCGADFTDLRRAIKRSCLRISLEVANEIRKQDLPEPRSLATAFDFAFPMTVLIAYDLGILAKEKGALLQQEDVATLLFDNFNESLQRFTADSLAECAVKWLVSELRKLTLICFNKTFTDSEAQLFENRVNDLIGLLEPGELTVDKLNHAVSATLDILDIIDEGELANIAQPLTTLWLAGMLGLRARQLLDNVSANISASNSIFGSTGAGVAMTLLTDPPQLVTNEVQSQLGLSLTSIDIGHAVDYLIATGVTPILNKYAPEFTEIRLMLEQSFGLSGGDIVEDIVRSISGTGSLSDLHSYTGFKQFVQQQILNDKITHQLLPLVQQYAGQQGNDALVAYLDEVVTPCNALVSDFIFSKLDGMMLSDVTSLDQAARMSLTQNISAGCGIVVYQVLARNFVYFDQIVTRFMLDNTHRGAREMQYAFSTPDHPWFETCRTLLENNLPGQPNLSSESQALQNLLLAMATALAEMTSEDIFTPQRRTTIYQLKKEILLSMSGDFNRQESQPLQSLVNDALDCLHIPNLDKTTQLATLLMEIQLECFYIAQTHISPALSACYLALTHDNLMALKYQLNLWISQLQQLAESALTAYTELADYIRTEIIQALDALQMSLSQISQDLETHLQQDLAAQAKVAVRLEAERIVTQNISDPSLQAVAINTFAAGQWLIINPILDVSLGVLTTTFTTLLTTLDDFVSNSTDAAQAFIDWQADIEAQLITDLQGMVVIPAAETARLILDIFLPPLILSLIEDYLTQQLEQQRLTTEQASEMQALSLLAAERDQTTQRYQQHQHRSNLRLNIVTPYDEAKIYPASITLSVHAQGLTDDILQEPNSKRIQFRLNGNILQNEQQGWQALTDVEKLWQWQSVDGHEFSDGINIFEVSWIRGADNSRIERQTQLFLVNTNAFFFDLQMQVDANPEGSDVDFENVLILWHGAKPLELSSWLLRDAANHRYHIPDGLSLAAGQQVRIYTGGDPAKNNLANSAQEKTLYMGRRAAILNNEGDRIELVDTAGTVIFTHAYGNALTLGG